MFSQVIICPQGGVSVQGVSVEGESLSRGSLCPGGLCPGGVSVQGDLCLGDPPIVKSGWYASYWNVFLFSLDFDLLYISSPHSFKNLIFSPTTLLKALRFFKNGYNSSVIQQIKT